MSPETSELLLFVDNDDYAELHIIVVMPSAGICRARASRRADPPSAAG